IVTAFVVVRPGVATTPELGAELGQFVKGRLGGHAYPREVNFIEDLPKTPSGKIQRFKLRATLAS
ncbi:MAG TPA: benzoate-CoA ligase family protein, partial [Thermomicrobiales bacterium]|nr:benzoate-CoA ligase family protein [Thermomicrobiales bacterium]